MTQTEAAERTLRLAKESPEMLEEMTRNHYVHESPHAPATAYRCYAVMPAAEKKMWREATLARLEEFCNMPAPWQRELNRKSLNQLLKKNAEIFQKGFTK